ncbi:TNF receptor-associated factor 6-like [Nylanderia fulva]|uniref:TNF receptor-associated factor 6-like n=1 Tax=Nylanderia fulva TaxID=613905 RepID=UPI0010FB51D4|nr:TNF receptor-associated factor 6-like [Nylanderia fulva]XP_029176722.1 TNF receptor-associated factor 6-like [Nylanderia fulva]XP_029176723.1 TNF receptor-associated factor 6-like [Nylanderia fulva]
MSTIIHYIISLLLFYLSTFYLSCSGLSESLRKIPAIEANVTNDDVTETQHTICKIATEDVVANARATVTTVLTGACKAKAMDEKFARLEKKLIKEFADIKWLLYNILEQQPDYLKTVQNANLYDGISDDYLSPRQDEINKFNNTVQNLSTSNGTASAFVYYWQIKNFDEMLTSWQTGRSMRSPTFYTGQSGYAMYLKITPKYFPDGTIFVGVGLTRGRFDAVLTWPFSQKIRLEVLDHSLEGIRENRRSRIWDPATLCTENFWGKPVKDNPECVGLSISRRVIRSKSLSIISQQNLRTTRYMWNGSVLIKLNVYLQII